MGYKVLYRKYRPDNFDNVVGQDYTVEMLKNAISTGKNAHAYIFTGPRGTGKTSSAKIFAKALNCEHSVDGNPCNECASCLSFKDSPDIIEIDAASNNGVDEIRELINNVKLVPSSSKYKVYIIDEVHMLTASAFNALLLTLEEPPSHVVFILATTDIQDVPITILSRCQRFDFKPISKSAIINRLKFVCDEENIKITDDALAEIALISAGGMRDALGMLDQLSSEDNEISLDMVSNYFGSVSVKRIDELLTAIEKGNSDSLLEILGSIKESGTNYSVFVEKLIAELRKCAIEVKTGRAKHDFYFETIYGLIFDLNECLCNININIDPYVLIEIVLLKYISSGQDFKYSNDSDVASKVTENVLGNKNENVGNKEVSQKSNLNPKKSMLKEDVNNLEVINNQEEENTKKIDVSLRINNVFVEADKDLKTSISKSWVDFMNYLMSKDRSLISLLADTSILAASNRYVLIQSSIDSTNDLINSSIMKLESFYKDFSGNKYRFAAVNDNLWKKEVEKYRLNRKNQIKYTYMEEDDLEESVSDVVETVVDDLEAVAKDIFGTYDVE